MQTNSQNKVRAHTLKALSQMFFTPKGFSSFVTNAGIKNDSEDLMVIFSERECKAAAVFTRNRVKGNPLLVGQKHIADGKMQALVVNSKNANVATGKQGYQNALAVCKKVSTELGIKKENVFPSSTGIIGRQLPLAKVVTALNGLKKNLQTPADFAHSAQAIMTTDTFAKYISVQFDGVVISAIAKGSGMIEPNMATMLTYFFTDAKISSTALQKILKRVTAKTFNSLSVDSDTSTSDTALILANGMAATHKKNKNKKKFEKKFEQELEYLATQLTRMLARDGEGATKLFVVDVVGCEKKREAKQIGKSIINSPLVKTAIYKGDPNWGRIFMAVGKNFNIKINPDKIKLFWGKENPRSYADDELDKLHDYLKNSEEIYLRVQVGKGGESWRVYGCDLTEEYVKINAYYST